MIIELAHSIVRDQIRKSGGGYKSPAQIDTALYRGLLDFLNGITTRPSRYLKEQPYNISGTNSFDLPEDFSRHANIFSLVDGQKYEGDVLDEMQFADRINSFILAPDLQNPVARIIGGKIEFYPDDAGNFILSYYRTPIKPVFGFDLVNGRNMVFDQETSTELDIDETDMNHIIARALFYVGISLKEESLLTENGNNP
jgi:hypothetical protein